MVQGAANWVKQALSMKCYLPLSALAVVPLYGGGETVGPPMGVDYLKNYPGSISLHQTDSKQA